MVTVPDVERVLHSERLVDTMREQTTGQLSSEAREALEKEHHVVTRFGEQAFGAFFGQRRGSTD